MSERTVRTYARVSTDEQALSGYSLHAQSDQLDRLAAARGWHVAGRYVDDGYSAKDTRRPALQALLQEAEPGDVVLVYKLDRLTRSVRDLDDLLREFDRRGLQFQSATEQFETTTASGRLFLRIVTEIAQWERETIAERSAMGKRKKVELGEWPGGPIPYGYRAEPSDRTKAGRTLLRLVPDPDRAHIVAALFDRYLAGHGMRALCRWLNDEMGVRTAGGARWRVSTLARLLTNPIYCGKVVYGRRGRGAQVRVQGAHPALVTPEAFSRVEELFAKRRQMAPRQATGAYPLAGAARCGVCGGPVDSNRRSGETRYIYRCRNHVNGVGCGTPPLASFPGHLAEARLVEALAALPVPAALETFLAEGDEAFPHGDAERRRLHAEQAEAEAAVRRWDRAYEAGAVPLDVFMERVRPLRERLALLQERHTALSAASSDSSTVPPGPYDLPLAWRYLDPPERKMLLSHFIAVYGLEVLLFPGHRLEVRHQAPALPQQPESAPPSPAGTGRGRRPATAAEAGPPSRA